MQRKLNFLKVVNTKFFKILFRRNRRIELLYFSYNKEKYLEKDSLRIIYKYKNVLYYTFGNYKALKKQIKINIFKKFDKVIELTIYGFLQKKRNLLKIEPKINFKSEKFNNKFNCLTHQFSQLTSRLNSIEIPNLGSNKIIIKTKTFISIPNIKVKNKPITIKKTKFNQNEFI